MKITYSKIDISLLISDIQLGIPIDMRQVLKEIEVDLINAAIGKTQGTVALAADLLKLKRTTLYERVRRFDKWIPNWRG